MGDVATMYGFYGGQDTTWARGNVTSGGEGGESLNIADPHEVWIFHVTPDDTGASAVWVAQRVPDDHISVVTNVFTIGEIDLDDSDYFMASENIFDVAIRNGFWDPASGEPFNFARVYREHDSSNFVDRRRWTIFNQVAPSLKLDPYFPAAWNGSNSYLPWSVRPEKLLDLPTIFRLHGDTYQDTPFDMSRNAIAGPWGSPARGSVPNVPPFNSSEWRGNFERAVAQTWTAYTVVTQSRHWLPSHIGGRFWFGPHDGSTTLWLPVYPAAGPLPKPLTTGSLLRVNGDSLYWPVCLTANYVSRFYNILLPNITETYARLYDEFISRAEQAETRALGMDRRRAAKVMAAFNEEAAYFALNEWWSFFFRLVAYFHDGMKFTPGVNLQIRGVPYPEWFLRVIGPEGVHTAEWANHHPDQRYGTGRVPEPQRNQSRQHAGSVQEPVAPVASDSPAWTSASATPESWIHSIEPTSALLMLLVMVACFFGGYFARLLVETKQKQPDYEQLP